MSMPSEHKNIIIFYLRDKNTQTRHFNKTFFFSNWSFKHPKCIEIYEKPLTATKENILLCNYIRAWRRRI